MDLNNFYFENVQEMDYHYRIYKTIKDINK